MANIDPKFPVVAVVFVLEGEPASELYRGFAMPHDGRLWLVANWLLSHGTGMKYPDQLIPMEKFPHHFGRSDGHIEITVPIPKVLLSPQIPEELKLEYKVVEFSGRLHIPGPSSTH